MLPPQLQNPEVQAKRKEMAQLVYLFSRKAVIWAEANGYSALIRDVDRFLAAYRKAIQAEEAAKAAANAQSYYEKQSTEDLARMIAAHQAKLDSITAALKAKQNGHH